MLAKICKLSYKPTVIFRILNSLKKVFSNIKFNFLISFGFNILPFVILHLLQLFAQYTKLFNMTASEVSVLDDEE